MHEDEVHVLSSGHVLGPQGTLLFNAGATCTSSSSGHTGHGAGTISTTTSSMYSTWL
jgi:hypothetical protein